MSKSKSFERAIVVFYKKLNELGDFVKKRHTVNPRVENARRCVTYGSLLTCGKHSELPTAESYALDLISHVKIYRGLRLL